MDHRIEARLAALETEIASLKEAVEADDVGPPTSDRRGMIKLVAASAVGVITGAVVLGAEPAAADPLTTPAAADGDAVAAGMNNLSTEATGFDASGSSGVVAIGENGVGVIADGVFGNAWFPGGGNSPAGTGALPGVLRVDAIGNWWGATVDSDTDGQWRKLAGPNTAGQLHVLPTPTRVYDSRPGQAPINVGPKSPTAVNAVRVINIVAGGPLAPLLGSINAVLINLTITGPQTAGFASAWPTGTFPGTSSINFAAGQSIAATTVVGCGPGATIQILANAITDFIVDVIGYYQ